MNPSFQRVILVEYHAHSAEALRRFLSYTGATVYVAPDVASARALAEAIKFDLLVTDIQLPDGTGWELAQKLKSECGVPAIAISGHNTLEDVAHSMRAGFVDHISKPLAPERLAAAMKKAMEARSASVKT